MQKVILEATLMAIGHNFRKMAAKGWKNLLLFFFFRILFLRSSAKFSV